MVSRLPSVNSLRAFVAAARHSSFKKAAVELNVTPAAISHQVKALEEELGMQLFRRFANGLELTPLGQSFLPGLAAGFEQLAVAVRDLRRADRGADSRLDVAVAPSFAAKWLLPRLHRFIAKYPEVDVRISAAENLIERNTAEHGQPSAGNAQDERQELAIAFGRGDYPGYRVDRLFAPSLALFCSPKLLQGKPPLRQPDDLRHHTLLHDDTPFFSDDPSNWNVWFHRVNLSAFDTSRRVHFSHAVLALDAAIEGLGVALSLAPLALLDVNAGKLAVPFGPAIASESGYYLLTPDGRKDRPHVALFRQWLMDEARDDDAQLEALLTGR